MCLLNFQKLYRNNFVMNIDHRTLQDLIDQQVSLVFCCQRCKIQLPLDIDQLVAFHGAQTRVSFVRRTFQCVFCQEETIKGQR